MNTVFRSVLEGTAPVKCAFCGQEHERIAHVAPWNYATPPVLTEDLLDEEVTHLLEAW